MDEGWPGYFIRVVNFRGCLSMKSVNTSIFHHVENTVCGGDTCTHEGRHRIVYTCRIVVQLRTERNYKAEHGSDTSSIKYGLSLDDADDRGVTDF